MTLRDPSSLVYRNLETQGCFRTLVKSKFVAVLAGWLVLHREWRGMKSQNKLSEYCTAQCCAAFYCTALSCPALYCTVLYCTVRNCAELNCTLLHCPVLHGTVLPCTALSCAALHCTTLLCIELNVLMPQYRQRVGTVTHITNFLSGLVRWTSLRLLRWVEGGQT